MFDEEWELVELVEEIINDEGKEEVKLMKNLIIVIVQEVVIKVEKVLKMIV